MRITDLDELIRTVTERPFNSVEMIDCATDMQPIVYLMRGLPSCGKSSTARKIAGEQGVIIETDAYFQGDQAGPEHYRFDPNRLEAARRWTLELFREALSNGAAPIVVDRGNGLNAESKIYAEMAIAAGYRVALCEPDSPWWHDIRVLLRYRPITNGLLDVWAEHLSELSQRTHRVKSSTIRRWMKHWANDLTIDEILKC